MGYCKIPSLFPYGTIFHKPNGFRQHKLNQIGTKRQQKRCLNFINCLESKSETSQPTATVTSAANPPTSSLQKKINEKKTWFLNDIVNRGLIVLVALLRLPIGLFDVLRYQKPRVGELLDVGDSVVLGHVDSDHCAH